jgi:hypothetical protein
LLIAHTALSHTHNGALQQSTNKACRVKSPVTEAVVPCTAVVSADRNAVVLQVMLCPVSIWKVCIEAGQVLRWTAAIRPPKAAEKIKDWHEV